MSCTKHWGWVLQPNWRKTHIYNNDILDLWIREQEEPILLDDDLGWLNEDSTISDQEEENHYISAIQQIIMSDLVAKARL